MNENALQDEKNWQRLSTDGAAVPAVPEKKSSAVEDIPGLVHVTELSSLQQTGGERRSRV
jgi:hypothetical protein